MKQLISLMHKACGRHNIQNVFDDFCTMTAIALSNHADPHHLCTPAKVRDNREKQYLDIIKKYDKKEQELFPAMAAELVEVLETNVKTGEYRDTLGELFHELELHNKWKGQFFTPQSVCDMMGLMVADKDVIKRTVKTYGYASVNEPACGSGAMLFGFVNACRGVAKLSREILFVAQDVDVRCVHMAYIQCALYGLPAVIRQMNTLTMQSYDEPWYTPVYVWDGWHYKQRRRHDVEIREKELLEMICG